MDSANSAGSLETSSNGENEYDSRAAANSFFSTTHQPLHAASISTTPPLFDPLSHYQTLLLNPNVPWPESTRPDPNPSFQTPTVLQYDAHQLGAARNPKKRSRASRRAPTTVLTTDTSNFRAMVQEFTGIPAQPFDNATCSFSASRLDLFGMRSAALEASPPYLRRPFAQKVQSPSFLVSSSSSLPITNSSNLFSSLPKFILSNSDHNQSSFQIQSNDTQFGLPNLIISPDQNLIIDNAERWRDGGGDDDYEAQMKRIRYGGIMDYNGLK